MKITMTMTPEEQFFQEIWWTLQQLKYLKISTEAGENIKFEIQIRPIRNPDEPTVEAQQRAILGIARGGRIKIINKEIEDDTYGKNVIFTIKFLPKFDKFYEKWEEIGENPWLSEGSRISQRKKLLNGRRKENLENSRGLIKGGFEYIRILPELIQNEIKRVYSDINYSDKAERKGWERKWNVLQTIWTIYHSNNKPNTLLMPIKALTINDRTIAEIDGILKGLEKEGCFWEWHRGTHNYELSVIYPERLRGAYNRTKEIYEKFAETYQEKVDDKNKVIEKWFNYKNNSINFYGEIYKPRSKFQAGFIRLLVGKHQRENNNGTILKPGQRAPEENLSNEINLTVKQLKQIKKQLSRSFKDKGFPLKIDSDAEGLLLIYTI